MAQRQFRNDLFYRNQLYVQQQDKLRKQLQGYTDFVPDTSETSTDDPAPDLTVTQDIE